MKRRIALVGTGARGISFIEPLVGPYRESYEVVGLCDLSPSRMAYYNELISQRFGYPEIPTYPAANFDLMLQERRPDEVIVCTIDGTHRDYIVRALQHGCDVITEKPMTIDAAGCRAILDTVLATKRRVRVAFNYRWGPFRTKVKELLAAGVIGQIHSVNLEYLLDTSHGADYFRRWHAHRSESGGLLIHKSSHHFDLVNWWLDAIPERVYAHGRLAYYGRANAVARGDGRLADYVRYTGEPAAKKDPFRLDLAESESFRRLYVAAEAETGYLRDRNVFRDDIDIYDQMNALVRYRTGEVLNYSLVAYSPREGMRVSFNGNRGRLEYHEFVGSHMNRAVTSNEFRLEEHGSAESEGEWIQVFPHFAPSYRVDMPPGSGPHGGADAALHARLFGNNPLPDPWQRDAGPEQGAAAVLVGVAANQSIAEQRPVDINEVLSFPRSSVRLAMLT